MTDENEYVPPVEALVPYQSAIASFRTKLPPDATVAFTFAIRSPAESYAIMIQRTLEARQEYEITVTSTALRGGAGRSESWRIHGVSRPIRFGDLTEAEHHAILGWVYEVAAYFQSTLVSFAYRV